MGVDQNFEGATLAFFLEALNGKGVNILLAQVMTPGGCHSSWECWLRQGTRCWFAVGDIPPTKYLGDSFLHFDARKTYSFTRLQSMGETVET